MKALPLLFVLVLAVPSAGCYHAQVTTGQTPGAVVIDKPFASSWIYGLIPPDTVEAASECASGVARVETQLSFVNYLVSAVTFGIYSPMHITVTCAAAVSAAARSAAAGGSELELAAGGTDVIQAFETAADEAVASGEAVYVRFRQVQP
jgi:hypothetical protein